MQMTHEEIKNSVKWPANAEAPLTREQQIHLMTTARERHDAVIERLIKENKMSQIEIACKDLVFHFNKKHLEDSSIPMWVVKAKGESYYVNHVTCELPWSTKETPDNSHTKGSIKVKRCLLTIDEDNCAIISNLTKEDEVRLKGKKNPIRIITSWGRELKKQLEGKEHSSIKTFGGACSTTWYVADVYSEKLLLLLQLAINDIRVLMPNEDYYQWYDRYDDDYIDEDSIDWEDMYEE